MMLVVFFLILRDLFCIIAWFSRDFVINIYYNFMFFKGFVQNLCACVACWSSDICTSISGRCLEFQASPGNSGRHLEIPGITRNLMVISGRRLEIYMQIPGDAWNFQTTPGVSGWRLEIPGIARKSHVSVQATPSNCMSISGGDPANTWREVRKNAKSP